MATQRVGMLAGTTKRSLISTPRSKKGSPLEYAGARIEYFDADGNLLFSSVIPALRGDSSLSFFGIVFEDACIARVRITSGNVAPGPDDRGRQDVVMMDDFLYGEPQPCPKPCGAMPNRHMEWVRLNRCAHSYERLQAEEENHGEP